MAVTNAVATPAVNRGGFWVRTGAYILDSIIAFIGGAIGYFVGSIVDASLGLLLYYVIAIGYFVYFWSAGGGQTLGMKALNLKVVRTDGSQLTIMQAVIRYIGVIVASIPLCIGLIWVAFDENKQGWHDKIAGTYVIRTK
jgi:uncharacterized RDD family membrane protein YckC